MAPTPHAGTAGLSPAPDTEAGLRQLESLTGQAVYTAEVWQQAQQACERERPACQRNPALLKPYLEAEDAAYKRYVGTLNFAREKFWPMAEGFGLGEHPRTIELSQKLFSIGSGYLPKPAADPRPKAEVIDLAARRKT